MTDISPHVRRRAVLASLGAGVASMAGCLDDDEEEDVDDDMDDDTDPADDPDEGATLAVTAVWTEGEQEDFEAVIDHVEGETGHEIEYHPRDTEELLTGTRMDYEAETTPADIVVIPSPARVITDGEAGHLEDTSGIWDEGDFATDADLVTVNDGVYAAPFGMDLKPGFWYRQSFFDEHGLEEPDSYDAFLDLLDEIEGIDGVDAPLASGNGDGWPLTDVVEAYLLRQDDGADLQEDLITGNADFTDERIVDAFEEIQETLQAGYWSDLREFGVQYEFFWENQIPLYFMGSWTPTFEAIEDPEDLDYFPLPGAEAMVAAVNWMTVPTYGDEVDASLEALEHIISADGQRVWAERGGFIPSHEDVGEDAFEQDIMADLLADAGEVRLVEDLDDALGDPFQSELWAQLLGFWTDPEADIEALISTLDDVHQETVAEEGLE